MLLHNQHYYLMAYNEKQCDVAFYRMDKITKMQISDDVRTPLKSVPGYKTASITRNFQPRVLICLRTSLSAS